MGKVALVTGSAQGIGAKVAERLAKDGFDIAINDIDRPQSVAIAEELAVRCREYGVKTECFFADVSKYGECENLVKSVVEKLGGLDVLVNNAGIASGGLFQMTTMQELRRLFEVNFFGQILLTQGIARLMQRHKAGSIINISSTAACIADPGTLGYGSSKAAFARASQSMATELGASGIRVNAIAPGVTRTDMFDQMTPIAREKLINSSSLRRAAEPQDIANMALFLASNLSTFVTGQILKVDGGIV